MIDFTGQDWLIVSLLVVLFTLGKYYEKGDGKHDESGRLS